MQDWNDISSELSFREKRNASRSLNENILDLAAAGFIIGARERHLLLTGGVSQQPQQWRVVEIEVQPFNVMQLADADGKPVDLNEAISKYAEKYADVLSKYTDVDDQESAKDQANVS